MRTAFFIMIQNLNPFEKKIVNTLKECNICLCADSKLIFGAAVSGGADSVSLLIALCNILNQFKIPLKVITVNHFIREDSETCADATFVKELCNQLKKKGFDVECRICELAKGKVFSTAKERKAGIEEAARFLRYSEFEKFIKEENLSYICLAHNQNDQLETLIMRFLQGSNLINSCGIPVVRDKIIRPLINTTREEIESYLKEKNQSWRTDSTNQDTSYLRNRIRNNLVPLLNKDFFGWQSSVLSGAKKNQYDAQIIEEQIKKFKIDFNSQKKCSTINKQDFMNLNEGMQHHLFIKAINLLSDDYRIPFVFLSDVISSLKEKQEFYKIYSDILIEVKKDFIIVRKNENLQKELFFSDIITREGKYDFPFGSILIQKDETLGKYYIQNQRSKKCFFDIPVCIRNVQTGDEILTADKKLKKVSDIFADWHVPLQERSLIPVIQDLTCPAQQLICILGEFTGFKNWILKENQN